jgi:ATP-dependent Clp protease protease subunit
VPIELREPLTHEALNRVTDAILASHDEVVRLVIDSPGGPVSTALAFRTLLRTCAAPVVTVCAGEAVGGAALLLASGSRRYMLAGARVSLGRPGGPDDKERAIDDAVLDDPLFFHELATATGADRAALEAIADGRWLSAHEAVELGFADRVVATLNEAA